MDWNCCGSSIFVFPDGVASCLMGHFKSEFGDDLAHSLPGDEREFQDLYLDFYLLDSGKMSFGQIVSIYF